MQLFLFLSAGGNQVALNLTALGLGRYLPCSILSRKPYVLAAYDYDFLDCLDAFEQVLPRNQMVTLLILNLGRIMGSNFERLSAFGNVNVREYQYQLAVYIYEKGLAGGNFSNATAVGLIQSFVGFLLVLSADRFAKGLGEGGLI